MSSTIGPAAAGTIETTAEYTARRDREAAERTDLDRALEGDVHAKYADLQKACTGGDLEQVKLIISPETVNKPNQFGFNPLMAAMACSDSYKRYGVARFLLANGAKEGINETAKNSLTALHTACLQGDSELVRLLISSGAKQKPARSGETPLHMICVRDNQLAMIEALATDPQSFNNSLASKSSEDCVPMHALIARGDFSAIRLIFTQTTKKQQKQWIDIKTRFGDSFLDVVVATGQRDATRESIIRLLLERGCKWRIYNQINIPADYKDLYRLSAAK